MNETIITLANRKYRVGFEEGQEQELAKAVALLNEEMSKLGDSKSGLQENQHLMLGGLLLAYRFASVDKEHAEMKEHIRELTNEVTRQKTQSTSLSKSEQELQNKIKALGDEKAKLAAEIEGFQNQGEEIAKLTKALEEAKSQAAAEGQNDDEKEELLAELTKMRTELNHLKQKEGEAGDVEQLNERIQSLEEENARLKSEGDASAELTGALEEMVASLEELAK